MFLLGQAEIVGEIEDGESISDVAGAFLGVVVFLGGGGEVFGNDGATGLLDGVGDGLGGQEVGGQLLFELGEQGLEEAEGFAHFVGVFLFGIPLFVDFRREGAPVVVDGLPDEAVVELSFDEGIHVDIFGVEGEDFFPELEAVDGADADLAAVEVVGQIVECGFHVEVVGK